MQNTKADSSGGKGTQVDSYRRSKLTSSASQFIGKDNILFIIY